MVDFFGGSKKKTDPYVESEHIVESAHKKAEKIVEKAVKKAEDIVDGMDVFKTQMEQEMKLVFHQASDSYIHTITQQSKEFTAACNSLIPPLKEAYTAEMQKAAGELRSQLLAMVGPLEKQLQGEMQTLRAELQRRMSAEFEGAKAEIQAYKTQQMQEVSTQLKAEVTRMASEVLGKALSPAEQERLVMEALEKAKAEGVFS